MRRKKAPSCAMAYTTRAPASVLLHAAPRHATAMMADIHTAAEAENSACADACPTVDCAAIRAVGMAYRYTTMKTMYIAITTPKPIINNRWLFVSGSLNSPAAQET